MGPLLYAGAYLLIKWLARTGIFDDRLLVVAICANGRFASLQGFSVVADTPARYGLNGLTSGLYSCTSTIRVAYVFASYLFAYFHNKNAGTCKYNLDFVKTYLSDSTLPRNTNCLHRKMDYKVTKESNCQEFQTPWSPFLLWTQLEWFLK